MPHSLEVGQRVNDRQHGDGSIYSITRGWVFVSFDNGSEDRAYPLSKAASMLGSVTEPMFAAVGV